MGTIAQLDGINVVMYGFDHPPPHVHFRGAGFKLSISIKERAVLASAGPVRPKHEKMFREWVAAHQRCLEQLWDEAVNGRPFGRLEGDC